MAAPSQTLPMVDGVWGEFRAHSITSIGYHLVFRAGGLRSGSNAQSAATVRDKHLPLSVASYSGRHSYAHILMEV